MENQNDIENQYPSIDDQEIIADFNTEGKVMVIFANPRSGSHQGQQVLDLAKKYNSYKDETYKILHFPYKKSENEPPKGEDGYSSGQATDGSSQELIPEKFDKTVSFTVLAFNILEGIEMQKALTFVKLYLQKNSEFCLKCLIGGGDGTVLGIVKSLKNEGIDLDRIIMGTMPFGTGNDLSNSLGFGNTCSLNQKLSNLNRVLYTYLIAQKCKIDIWDLEVKLKESGTIWQVVGSGEKVMIDKETNTPLSEFKTTFINYSSIGFDARVGFDFEQNRSSSQCWNKVIYGWEAFKRVCCCCSTIVKISDILDNFCTDDKPIFIPELADKEILLKEEKKEKLIQEPSEKNVENMGSKEELIPSENKKEELQTAENVMESIPEVENTGSKKDVRSLMEESDSESSTRTVIFDILDKNQKVKLKGDPVVIICQNINCYMAGTRDIWGKAGNSLSTTIGDAKKEEIRNYRQKLLETFGEQKFDDKKLEFFSYTNALSMGIERYKSGMADKLYQGEGPFVMNFKENPSKKEPVMLDKVYINSDGEFYHLMSPKYLKISRSQIVNDGQINILRNLKKK